MHYNGMVSMCKIKSADRQRQPARHGEWERFNDDKCDQKTGKVKTQMIESYHRPQNVSRNHFHSSALSALCGR